MAFPGVCLCQSLRLSSVAALQGDRVAIEISLASPDGDAPQLLQWETTIPTARLSFLENQLQAGPASQASEKSVSCATKINNPDTRTLTCIVGGGLKTIPNGVVALLRLRILPDAPTGPAPVNTARGVAVLPGLKEVLLPAAKTIVTVRPASDASASKK